MKKTKKEESKKEDMSFFYVNQLPKKLDEILAELKQSLSKSAEDAKHLEEILAIKEEYAQSGEPCDTTLEVKLLNHVYNGSGVFSETYIGYMGLTFHYNETGNNDAAWFYYAKAQKSLGIHESWSKLLDHIAAEDSKTAKRARAAKLSCEKTNMVLINAFTKIANNPPSKKGWSNKRELIDEAFPKLEKLHLRAGFCFPKYENLEKFMWRHLQPIGSPGEAFYANYSGCIPEE